MSDFSQLLSNHIHEKNIKTYALAQYCGLDRSNMYKLINGKRKPSSLEMVQKICKFLNLSYAEQQEMETAYEITVLGSENYYRRKDVLRFFNSFQLPKLKLPIFTGSDSNNDLSLENGFFLSARTELDRCLYHIISEELRKPNGHICLHVQPDYEFLLQLLAVADYDYSNVKIEHIICIDNESSTSHNAYNLHCLENLLPLYGNTYDYTCYYYYDHIKSRQSSFNLFSEIVITSNYACIFTSDYHHGILFNESDHIHQLTSIFKQSCSVLSLLLHPLTDPVAQLEYISDMEKSVSDGYSFQMSPCLMPYFTMNLLEKYLITDIPYRNEIMSAAMKYIQRTYWDETSASHINCIFSLDGLKKFMKTGRLGNCPQDMYKTIELSDRVALLKALFHDYKKRHIRILKENIGSLDNELFLFVTGYKGYLIMQHTFDHQLFYLNIEEPGLLSTFLDFCSSLNDNLFFTAEEADVELKNLLLLYNQPLKLL